MSGTAARVASGHEDFWQAFRSEQAASLAELDNLERNGESSVQLAFKAFSRSRCEITYLYDFG